MATATEKETSRHKNGADEEAPKEETTKQPQVLDLTDLTPSRRLVKLKTKRAPEGETFELRLLEDFGIELQQKLMMWSRNYTKLVNSDVELNDTQLARMRFCLESIFEEVLDAPKTVKSTMDDTHKIKVMSAFSTAPILARQELQMALIQRLIDKGVLTQESVDEVLAEVRAELTAALISES